MKNNYVFTYGTLLKGERNHHLLSDLDFISEAIIKGFKIFDLGRYPGIEYGEGIVEGELYLVDDIKLKELDFLEEEGSLYLRKTTTVYTQSEKEFEAFVYVYNKKIVNPKYISSWKNR